MDKIDWKAREGAWHERPGQGIDLIINPERNLGAVYWYTLPQQWYYGVFDLDTPEFTMHTGIWDSTQAEPFTLLDVGHGSLFLPSKHHVGLRYQTNGLGRDAVVMSCVASSNHELNGSYFDPALNGTGWSTHIFQDGEFISTHWYTYDDGGSPCWYTAQGKRVRRNTFDVIIYNVKGMFRYGEGELTPVGQATIEFDGKGNAQCAYDLRGTERTEEWRRLI